MKLSPPKKNSKTIFFSRLFLLLFVLASGRLSIAQQGLTAEQQQKIKEAQTKLDSFKKANPSMAGMIPDINKKIQDATTQSGQAQSNLKQAQSNMKNIQAMQQQMLKAGLPTLRSGISADPLKSVTPTEVIALAQAKLKEATDKLAWDPFTKSQLDKMTLDTTINLAATGVVMLVGSMPKYPSEYLICKAVLKLHPSQWAINDLGILFRDDNKNKEALQCFLYAEQLDDKSITIKSNIGWAAAYYGDFTTGKKYFNEALAINENFGPALEGLALIAYQQGDIAALFQALAKQITGLGGGGDGPSAGFSSLCGGVQMDQQMQKAGKPSNDNPNDNHTYDGKEAGEDDAQQDPPATGDAEPPTYPSFRPIFVTKMEELFTIGKNVVDYTKKAAEIQNQSVAILQQKLQSLPILHPRPYVDEHGDKIIPYSYEKFYSLFHSVHILFEQRLNWTIDHLEDEMKKYIQPIFQNDMDLLNNYTKALGACKPGDEGCVDRVNCEWIPRLKGSKNNDIDGAARIWNKYFDQLVDNIHWYTQSSDPFIKKVYQPGWNEYMNMVREWDVRRAILKLYTDWGSEIMEVNGNGVITGIVVAHPVLNCHTDMPLMGGGADPFSKKTGKLKTFAGKCYKEPSSFDAWVVSYEDDCDKTKISVTIGAAKVFKEWDYSKKFKEDDTYRTGITIGVSKSLKVGGSAGGVSASGGVNVGADVTLFSEYYSNTGARKGSGITLDLAASVGASASVQLPGGGFGDMASDLVNSNVSRPKISAGVSATVEIYANAGADGSLGAFNVTSVNVQKK